MNASRIKLVALGLLLLTGCMSLEQMAPLVDDRVLAAARPQGYSADTLSRGRRIYVTTCAKCHTVEPIGRYSLDEWKEILPEMADESNLDEAQRQDLTAYVLTALQVIQPTPSSPTP